MGLALVACEKNQLAPNFPAPGDALQIKAVDISSYPEIAARAPIFFNEQGNPEDFLTQLQKSGVNTIRLRLWVQPARGHSGLDEVAQLSDAVKGRGFKTWVTVHYSDTWADPSQQNTPAIWAGLPFNVLKDSVYGYTARVVSRLQPDFIQVGNEINNGFLHPQGAIATQLGQFLQLLDTAILAVRQQTLNTKIVMHYAGISGADWFFNQLAGTDYDVMGLSYYPMWHGKSLQLLKATLANLTAQHQKEIVIAETAYPFTLGWNDWTHNVVGLPEQLILPDFPATPEGQRAFLFEIKKITQEVDKALGFCYWGGELIAWDGPESTSGSSWENQALFDFSNRALPVLQVYKEGS